MRYPKTICFEIPGKLLEKVDLRAGRNSRTRNGEFRYLLTLALDHLVEEDIVIEIDLSNKTGKVARVDFDLYEAISERSRNFQRPIGGEIVRLLAFAVQLRIEQELASIARAMKLLDPVSPGTPEPG